MTENVDHAFTEVMMDAGYDGCLPQWGKVQQYTYLAEKNNIYQAVDMNTVLISCTSDGHLMQFIANEKNIGYHKT